VWDRDEGCSFFTVTDDLRKRNQLMVGRVLRLDLRLEDFMERWGYLHNPADSC